MARKMSPEEFQELGRRYYKLKQYEKALEVFTQGIEASPTVDLYDHRAATYDKLKDFSAAVKDGREMIKLDKKEVKGYLRTASVLERMEKPETALGIYKYGMKNVPVSDKNFKLLQQLHDKLTRKLSPATAIDPFTILPVELAEMILEYLSFRHIVNCMRVSKGWRDYLSKLPKLWMHLDLSGARKPVPRSFVNLAVRRSGARLTRVTIHRFEHVDMLKNLAKVCKELTELEFITLPHTMSSTLIDMVQCAPNLKKFVVHPDITIDTVTQILRYRPTLEHVGIGAVRRSNHSATWNGPFGSLKTFSMHLDNHMPPPLIDLITLLSQSPTLQSLSLSNVGNSTHPMEWASDAEMLPPLTDLVLKRVCCSRFPILPPTLQRLVLDFDSSHGLKEDRLRLLRPCLPQLTHFSLSGVHWLCADILEILLDLFVEDADDTQTVPEQKSATPLQHLSIHGLLRNEDGYTQDGLFKSPQSLFGRSPRILTKALESLDIAALPCDDDEIEHLLTYETGLQSIDLSYTNITGASIKMLADKLPTLKSIKADNCTRINGRDAIHYAERKGIAVNCQMEERQGGRRIRYG